MDYKKLSKFEKLQEIKELSITRCERHEVAVYLKALWLNDTETIDSFEKFGDTPYKIFTNKRYYERQLLFGFTNLEIDENGWIKNTELLEKENYEFKTKNESRSSNYFNIGRGINGNWTFGLSYSTGASGGSALASIWNEIVESKELAIKKGLNALIEAHNRQRERLYKKDSCGNYKEDYSRAIVKLAQERFDELTGKNAVQLQLF